jgi:hypothetical protein
MGGQPNPLPPGTPTPGPLSLPAWQQAVAILTILLLYGWEGVRAYKAGRLTGKTRRDFWIVVVFQIVGFLAWFNEARLPGIWRYLASNLGLRVTQMITLMLVIGLGWCAYRFKLRNKLYYGYLQVFFGLLSAAAVIQNINFAVADLSNETLAHSVALIGAAFVVANGLRNRYEAKHPTTPSR